VEIEWWDSPLKMPQFPPWRPTHYEQSIFEPIPDEDIPFVESTWQMVFTTWSVATAASAFDFEEEPLIPLPEFRTMPLYPQWMPPDHPSYYSDEPEVVHPEVFEYRTLPIWLPWRPIPHLDYFSDEQEEIFIDKYQNLPRLPVWIPPHIKYVWYPGEEDEPPIEPGWDFIPPMGPLPPPRPYFMPEQWPPEWIDEKHVDLCPPPCLRRASPTCPPPEERPPAGPTPP
jgi:hypothetical protein